MTAILPIAAAGRPRRRRGGLIALLVVLACHTGLVALLAVERAEIRVVGGPPAEPAAIPVILWPAPDRAPAAKAEAPVAAGRRALRRRHETAQAQAAPATAAAPSPSPGAAQAQEGRAEAPGWPSFGPNLARRIRPQIGCAHPEAYRLSDREQADCDQTLGAQARLARDLGPRVPPAKAAAYDRALHCRRVVDNNPMPLKLPMFRDQEVGPSGARPGEGPAEEPGIVSARDCPPGAN